MDIVALLTTASMGYFGVKFTRLTADVLGEYLKPLMKMSGEAHADYLRALLYSNSLPPRDETTGTSTSQKFAEFSYNLQLSRLVQILQKTIPLLDENASSPSPQWNEHFRKDAAHIIDEDLQVLWANVLAQECNAPGSVNNRVLSRIAELNRTDAIIFNAFLEVTANNAHVLSGSGSQPLDYANLSYDNLLQMVEAGLIHSEIAHNVEHKIYKLGDNGTPVSGLTYYHHPNSILVHSSDLNFVSPPSYSLSQVGQVLSKSLKVAPSISKLSRIYQEIRDRGYILAKVRTVGDTVVVDTSFTSSNPIAELFS